jgi:signal transduction histidine kinase
MQLGILRETAGAAHAQKLDRLLDLVNEGIRGIRDVTDRLRPPLLDDLGLLPALRGLVDDFAEHHHVEVRFESSAALPPLENDAELALFRALQEALSNVARHAGASAVTVTLQQTAAAVRLIVRDNGRGVAAQEVEGSIAFRGGSGLAGMRERLALVGGHVSVGNATGGGAEVMVELPIASATSSAAVHGEAVAPNDRKGAGLP